MESILRDKIVEFLEKNNIIRDSQHGFRNKRSCLTNLLDFLHYIYEMYEEGRAVDIIYLDFQKVFDKVPHRKLLNKVESHGISGHIHRWISDFFFFFFNEWEHRMGTMCPLSSLHPSRNGKERQ